MKKSVWERKILRGIKNARLSDMLKQAFFYQMQLGVTNFLQIQMKEYG